MWKWALGTFAIFSLSAGEFETLCTKYEKGHYREILDEIDFLYRQWEKEGALSEFLASRRIDKKAFDFEYKKKLNQYKKVESKLRELEAARNALLLQAIRGEEKRKIGQVIQKVVLLSELIAEHGKSADFFALLEAGGLDEPGYEPIEKILREKECKTFVVHSLLLSSKIDLPTFELYASLVTLDALKRLRSFSLPHCKEAILLEEVRLSLAYDQKFLSDLLVGMRGPESPAEEKVKEILRTYQAQRDLAIKH